jgi:3-keto-disaccharide hydrolase
MPRSSIRAIIPCLAVFAAFAGGMRLVNVGQTVAEDKALPTFTDAAQAGPDFAIQGEYTGELTVGDKKEKYGVQVIALGDGKFHAVAFPGGLPGDGWDKANGGKEEYDGQSKDGVVVFKGDNGVGTLKDGAISVSDADGKMLGELKRVERKSPTLGAKPPAGALVLFDGSTAQHFKGGKMTGDKLLVAGPMTKQGFNDFTLHLEFRTPFMPTARGQERGNSGVYLQNRYEVQVLDSFGLEGKDNECGGFYSVQAPKVNMCLPPLAWQTYDVDFTAARFDAAGKKTKNAVVSIRHNGVPIHENFELPGVTPGGEGKETPVPGPLALQFHGNPVYYRNIWIVEKK